MSFSPLPDAFLTDLRTASKGPVVELGSGDGRFSRVLVAAGARLVVSDRSPGEAFALGTGLRADATAPPLREVPLLVVANLLRHLWDPQRRPDVLSAWIACLASGGRLYIFEDEPAGEPGPARNYRDLQALLARIVPWRQGLLARCEFERSLNRSAQDGAWSFGSLKNQFSPADRHDVLSLLEDERGVIPAQAMPLARRVAEEGVDYGCYWWARFERE